MNQAARTLVYLPVSPWSERARWALDHHGLAYRKVVHTPVIGERRLRKLVGPGKARATVPVLVEGDEVLGESWDIVLYADRHGAGTPLVPPAKEDEIRSWVALADRGMSAGRGRVVAAMLASPAALDEGTPPVVPRALRPLFRPVARAAMRAFARKYDVSLAGGDDPLARLAPLHEALDELRRGLSSGAPYLLGGFTYADIAMSSLIQGFAPVAARFLRLGPATRAAWTDAALASTYADLVAWRDRLYDAHRARPAAPVIAPASP